MIIEEIFDGDQPIAHIYDLRDVNQTEFPTPAEFPFQFGVAVTPTGKTYQPHVHKSFERTISATAEFIYVLQGVMHVKFLNHDGVVIRSAEIEAGKCFLQISGGHALSTDPDTKYFELKQGPYFGRHADKFDVDVSAAP